MPPSVPGSASNLTGPIPVRETLFPTARPIHGTAVAINGKGILIRGASGSGKSDLALRLIADGAILIADDQVIVTTHQDGPYLAPPTNLAGLIEVRGVGIRRLPFVRNMPLILIVDLVDRADVPRLPDVGSITLSPYPNNHGTRGTGTAVRHLRLWPFAASTPAAIRLALTPAVETLVTSRIGSALTGAEPFGSDYTDPIMSDRDRNQDGDQITAGPHETAPGPVFSGHVLLITGLSGAGRSSSLKLLEDMGYEAVDNLPLALLPNLIGLTRDSTRPLAVGIDIRTRDFLADDLAKEVNRLTTYDGLDCRLVFLDCDDEALARRFTETRRRHPLADGRAVMDGIQLERVMIAPLRAMADLVIDTSVMRPAELKQLLAGHFALDKAQHLQIFVTSFSFRHGLPREADLVFDVRFLDNPYYDPSLRPLTGLDGPVGAHVAADPDFPQFFTGLAGLLRPLLPRYHLEGKSYLTIAIGCTGGRHRSVYVAQELARWLQAEGQMVTLAHRDILKPLNPAHETPARPDAASSGSPS